MAISRTEVTTLGSSLFECTEDDINNNKHIPNSEGLMESTGIYLKNGDKLSVMDGEQDVYRFSSKDNSWLKS